MTLCGHEGAVTCLQFDDSRIISGALDRLIKIWSLSTGQACTHVQLIIIICRISKIVSLVLPNFCMISFSSYSVCAQWIGLNQKDILELSGY